MTKRHQLMQRILINKNPRILLPLTNNNQLRLPNKFQILSRIPKLLHLRHKNKSLNLPLQESRKNLQWFQRKKRRKANLKWQETNYLRLLSLMIKSPLLTCLEVLDRKKEALIPSLDSANLHSLLYLDKLQNILGLSNRLLNRQALVLTSHSHSQTPNKLKENQLTHGLDLLK